MKKHLVDAIDDTVRYDEKQDFSAFDERSAREGDEEFVRKEFQKYSFGEAFTYLKHYKGKLPFQKYFRRLFPKWHKSYILKSYQRKQLHFTLHSLRSEQNREIAIEGIKQLLKIRILSIMHCQ